MGRLGRGGRGQKFLKGRLKTAGRCCLSAALACGLALGLAGCKPTDFLTEIVLYPFTDVYDPNTIAMINSPDSEEESAILSALDWTEKTPSSADVENVVAYSTEPNTILSTHHAYFDLEPKFPGFEASDGVSLAFEDESEWDETPDEPPEDEQEESEAQSEVAGITSDIQNTVIDALLSQTGAEGSAVDETAQSVGSTTEPTAGETESSTLTDDLGELTGGDVSTNENVGDAYNAEETEQEGDSFEAKRSSYNGTLDDDVIYDVNSAMAHPNKVDSLAVIGTDLAVMVEALGGAGSICAMSSYAYYGKDEHGDDLTTCSSFAEMFGGELPADFADTALFWTTDAPSGKQDDNNVDWTAGNDIETLIDTIGDGGIIIYDQTLCDYDVNNFFSPEEATYLQYAADTSNPDVDTAIQLIPVDMSTVQGILDAAKVIGEALQESPCEQDAYVNYEDFRDTMSSLVKAVTARHGGGVNGKIKTDYNGYNPRTGFDSGVTSNIAVDYETGLELVDGSAAGLINISDILLFEYADNHSETTLPFWQQIAGLSNQSITSARLGKSGLAVLWPLGADLSGATPSSASLAKGNVEGYSERGAYSRWLGTGSYSSNMAYFFNYYFGNNYGLGSAKEPYLIVPATDGHSVKNALVKSMQTSGSLYYAANYLSTTQYQGFNYPAFVALDGETKILSSIGVDNSRTACPFYSGLSASDVVRENPTGLLGSWFESNMESVLEAVWLSEIYSEPLEGAGYTAEWANVNEFSVKIGDVECDSAWDAMLAFYEKFYRYQENGNSSLVESYVASMDW